MKKIGLAFLVFTNLNIINGCKQKSSQKILSAKFQLGTINIISKKMNVENAPNLMLMTRFEISKKGLPGSLNNYFQYELGKKINMIIGGDTLKPVLFYFVPLINENEKEIDSKFVIKNVDFDKPKRIIINDTLLEFNKVNILFK